jgi:hypothetical protein
LGADGLSFYQQGLPLLILPIRVCKGILVANFDHAAQESAQLPAR